MSEQPPPRRPPSEAIAQARVSAPTRGNRKLEQLLAAVNDDPGVKALWYVSGVNATDRLGMSDHSWVHIQIVVNIALRMARLLFRRGVVPSVVADHGLEQRDAEVVIAAGALFHCVGMAVHRTDHEAFSLFLTADRLPRLLEDVYQEPQRTIIVAETLHAIISHRRRGLGGRARQLVRGGRHRRMLVARAPAVQRTLNEDRPRHRAHTRNTSIRRSSCSASIKATTSTCFSRPDPRSLVASSSSTWKIPAEFDMTISTRTAVSWPGSTRTSSIE